MPRKNPPARWVLPEVIDPPDSICVTIPVPNDRQHIAAFWGAILNLASGVNWADDPDHKARLVAHVWREIFDSLKPDSCDVPDIPLTVEEWEDILSICESLRFHDGKLQGLCCGEWSDISGQDGQIIGGSDQQGDGAPQPEPGGGCQMYHAKFNANTTYLLPVLVNSGDTLAFTNPDGAGHDGSFLATWRCPDGGTFFGGKCLPIYASDGADPNPAIHHIALIAQINGVYYPAYEGTITVPGGVVSAQVILQVNDATIGDNGGSYSVDVEVCNNAVAGWSHILAFTSQDYGFTPFHPLDCATGGYGTWTPGSGFVVGDCDNGVGTKVRAARFEKNFAATTINAMSMSWNATVGANGAGGTLHAILYWKDAGGTQHAYVQDATPTGTAQTMSDATPQTIYGLIVGLDVDYETSPGPALGGSGNIMTVTISGSGFDPFA